MQSRSHPYRGSCAPLHYGMRKGWACIQADASNAHHFKVHGEHFATTARRVVRRGMVNIQHPRVGERRSIGACGFLSLAVEPEADRVFGGRMSWMVHSLATVHRLRAKTQRTARLEP